MKFRPEADIFPLEPEERLRELAKDIDQRGQLQPIYLYEGAILDGRNRWLAITRYSATGVEPKFEAVAPESPIAFVVSLNEKRRHLNDSQRQWAAQKALPFYETEANRRRAEAASKGGQTAGRSRPIASASIEAQAIPSPRRATAEAAKAFSTSDGGVQRAKRVAAKASKKLAVAVEAGELSLGKAEQIVKQHPDKKAQDAQVAHIRQSRMATRVKGLTGEIEWYTPRRYLDAAVAVMGGIDLDPASSHAAQGHVKAKRFFTMSDDGLAQRWSGRVFLNPPYAMPTIKQFVSKMTGAYEGDEFSEGILLTNNATDTEWFHTAAKVCTAICLTRGRISFLQARDGELLEKASPTHGQAFFYFGPSLSKFRKVFGEFGLIFTPEPPAGTS
jgi:phage N-6-adenine-methyltransferase